MIEELYATGGGHRPLQRGGGTLASSASWPDACHAATTGRASCSGTRGDMAKGSGRSVDGVSLVEILAKCPEGISA